jgi:choline dehydrogenase
VLSRAQACSAVVERLVRRQSIGNPGAVGVGPLPFNVVDGIRQSAALTHLAPARECNNLTIRAETVVDRIVFEGRRAVGVALAGSGEVIRADGVTLAAGSYGSPALLLRSGIGSKEQLRTLGVAVVEDLPGVGENLADHPLLGLRYDAAPPSAGLPGVQVMLSAASSDAEDAPDLQIMPWTAYADPASPSGGVFTLFVALMRPQSRGRLSLRSLDPNDAPLIERGYFADPADTPRMLRGVQLAHQLAETAPLSRYTTHKLSRAALSSPSGSDLELAILAEVGTYHHPVGTCRMGLPGDPAAVVDLRGAVRGTEGLFVVDASIMPAVPSVNSNLTILMLAERCARWLSESLWPGRGV